MATYKVIQDIEAEDKLIGWMTPRQTIYAAIVVVSGFIGFMFASNGAWWLSIFLLPHMILFIVLAGPFVHDQPSEVWLLAKIQFFLKPKQRIWDQSGLKELVTITVPKKIERRLTDGLSQTEVKSRLQALANTIDSRGWALKNVDVSMYGNPSYATAGSDRLIDTGTAPQAVPMHDITAQDDILDERNNRVAQQLDQMINQSTAARRTQITQAMQNPVSAQAPQDYWFMNSNSGQTVQPGSTSTQQNSKDPSTDEQKEVLSKALKEKKKSTSHLKTIKTLDEQKEDADKAAAEAAKKEAEIAATQYATDNNLSIATIAKQAGEKPQRLDDGEVVISLH